MKGFNIKKSIIGVGLFIVLALASYPLLKSYYGEEIVLCTVGDILLDRGVAREMKGDYHYPYRKVKHILEAADITLGNLECPLTTHGTPALKRPIIIFKADPQNAEAIKGSGFDILNLANNHTMDYGTQGVVNTMKVLKEFDIDFIGAGINYGEARKPLYIEKKDCRIGFLGYSVFPPEGYISFSDRPDVAKVAMESLREEIKSAKKECDLLVVSFHWGKEYDFYAGRMQKDLAHTVIDSGGDLVLGHHPHVLQGVERYKDGIIFYSLGNFVFDRQIQRGTDETIIVNFTIKDKNLSQVEIIPAKIRKCQPYIVGDKEGEHILNRLKLYSDGMNTDINIRNSIGYIELE